jgi:hypothetical protein
MKKEAEKFWSSMAGLLALFKKVFGKPETFIVEQLFLKDISLAEWSRDEKRDFEMRVRILQRKAEIVLNEIEAVFLELQEISLPLSSYCRYELEIKLMKGDSVWEVAQTFFDPYQLELNPELSDEAVEKLTGKFSDLKERGFLTANFFTKEEGGDRSKLFPWEEQYIGFQERT